MRIDSSLFLIFSLLFNLPSICFSFFPGTVTGCTDAEFWGNCYSEGKFCLCHQGLWYSSSVPELGYNTFFSFNNICHCGNTVETMKCTNTSMYNYIIAKVLPNGRIHPAGESQCQEMLLEDLGRGVTSTEISHDTAIENSETPTATTIQTTDTSEATTVKATETANVTVIETKETFNATGIETTETFNGTAIETTESPITTVIETTYMSNSTAIETTEKFNGTVTESTGTVIETTKTPNTTVIETTETSNGTVIETTETSNDTTIETTETSNSIPIETTVTSNDTAIETTETSTGPTLEATKVTSIASTETSKGISALVTPDASTTGTFLNSGESCPCACDYFDKVNFWSNESNLLKQFKDLEVKLTEIRNQLVVNVRNLSSSVRLRVSAPDERQTSAVMGTFGIIIMSLVFGGIIISDFPIFFQHIRTILRKLKKS